jgi:hypothetical protein
VAAPAAPVADLSSLSITELLSLAIEQSKADGTVTRKGRGFHTERELTEREEKARQFMIAAWERKGEKKWVSLSAETDWTSPKLAGEKLAPVVGFSVENMARLKLKGGDHLNRYILSAIVYCEGQKNGRIWIGDILTVGHFFRLTLPAPTTISSAFNQKHRCPCRWSNGWLEFSTTVELPPIDPIQAAIFAAIFSKIKAGN